MRAHGKTGRRTGALFVMLLLAFAGARAGDVTPADIPARIAKAEVGEWALYRLPDGRRLRLTVVEEFGFGKTRGVVIEKCMMNARNRVLDVTEETVNIEDAVWDLTHLSPGDELSMSEILIGKRRIDAVVISYAGDGEPALQSYFSDEVPVYGLVKGVKIGKAERIVMMQLIDHGFAEE
ncbi:MAG: hypothetical protein LBJ46_06215 [Planctomycetota bacterium]|jgi:hypothetical protein|nr:hypothetical protein [Planctomycetota bacterium]